MTFWHRHRYVEVQRVFTGRVKLGPCEGSADVIQKMLMGATTIISRCECGKLYTTQVLGDATLPVDIEALNRMMK